jgi:apolipoprotein N-acyltransferase
MPANLWLLAYLAVALFATTVVRARRLRAAVGLGAIFGLGLLIPAIFWQAMITTISYVALVAAETFFYGLLGGLLWLARGRNWTPLVSAGVWVAVEAAFSRWPFNGFGWLRLGYTQIDSPLAGLLPFGGVALASLGVAVVGQLLALAWERRDRFGVWLAGFGAVSVGVLGALGMTWEPGQADLGSVNIGYVQGGAKGGGLYGLGELRSISHRHADEVDRLMGRVEAGVERPPALIVLPENTTDMDPIQDPETRALMDRMARRAGVPLLVGVPVSLGEGMRKTSTLWWNADGPAGEYQKRNLVPFGEWVPFREVFEPMVPQLAYVGDQSIPGREPGVVTGVVADGSRLSVGASLCYDVAYPATMADLPRAGADVIVVQSNNAMFGHSAQVPQQFAITRARAAELRREILVVTTSGQSGLIGARGEVVELVPSNIATSGVVEMPVRDTQTPFVRGGWLVEPVVASAALLALLATVVRERFADGGQWGASASATPASKK